METLTESEKDKISKTFMGFFENLSDLAREYQPGREANFYEITLANWVLVFDMAYRENALPQLIQIAESVLKKQAAEKGIKLIKDFEGGQ
jgi:hypothetical protein